MTVSSGFKQRPVVKFCVHDMQLNVSENREFFARRASSTINVCTTTEHPEGKR